MLFRINKISGIALATFFLVGCSNYQKVLKNEEVKPKYELAEKLFEEGDYKKANKLLEQVAPRYVGKPQGERVMFFLADTYFKLGDYNFAGYQFERFLKSYPRSNRAAEAAFLGAKSYYFLSPRYSLDQTDTDKALTKLQSFINNYPESSFLVEANTMARELTTKKEKKAFEIAKQFTKLGKSYILDYNISAIAALENFITDHPGSVFREEAFFLKLSATTTLALNSTDSKKEVRLEDAKVAYDQLMRNYPESQFSDQAVELKTQIDRDREQFEEQESLSK